MDRKKYPFLGNEEYVGPPLQTQQPVAKATPINPLPPYLAPEQAPPPAYYGPSAATPARFQLEGKERVPSLLNPQPTPGTIAHTNEVKAYQDAQTQPQTQPGVLAQTIAGGATLIGAGAAMGVGNYQPQAVRWQDQARQVVFTAVGAAVTPLVASAVQSGLNVASYGAGVVYNGFGRAFSYSVPSQPDPIVEEEEVEDDVKEPSIPPGGPPGDPPIGSNNWLDIRLPDGKTDWSGVLIVAGLIGAGIWAYYSREAIKKAVNELVDGAIGGVAIAGAGAVVAKEISSNKKKDRTDRN